MCRVTASSSNGTWQYLYSEHINDHHLSKTQIPDEDIHAIKEGLKYNYPLGNEYFKEQVEFALGRAVGQKQRGRSKVAVDIG